MSLSGYRIVDLTRVISGPFCSMILADLGADVIKVEAPEGDPLRTQGAAREGLSWYYAGFNRNKRSIVLDLKTKEGRLLLEKLIASADALVENFRPGVLDRLGFSDARLQEIRPGLVVCAISGFGPNGPYKDRPAFDFIAQAMSGFMSVTGERDGPPLRTGIPLSDLIAGLYGALGIATSFLGRPKAGGLGERVDVSLTSSTISLMAYMASNFFATGEVPRRSGNDHPIAAPYGMFKTRDGEIAIAPSIDAFFHRLMDVLGLPELKNDPDYANNALRVQHRARLSALLEEKLSQHDSAYWIETINAAGVPCGPVNDLAGVFADPQVQSQNMSIEVEHPGRGMVRTLGFPIRLANEPCRVRRPAPELGQHTDEVLAEIGYGETERADFRQRGAVA
jgi:CoA:oxalate CoA-transferase